MKKMKTVLYGYYYTRKMFQKKPRFCYKNVKSYVNLQDEEKDAFQSKARFHTVPGGRSAGAKAR